jgi:HemY protein
MLTSLTKILMFVAVVAAVAFGAGLLMENGPGVQITVGTQELNLGPLQAVILALVVLLILWVILKALGLLLAVWKFINGDDTAISRYFDRNRERRGYQAMADGLMAIASGEGKAAMAKAAKAERYLNRPELTNLITAQAAEMAGDRRKAEETYKKLLTDDRTRFVGIRGILKQKLSEGDTETALKLAEKAFALKPKHAEIQDTLLTLQAKDEDWTGARRTLGAKLKHGNLPRDVHRRRDAVLALSESSDKDGKDASALAIEANRLSPQLVPAAVMAARAYITEGKPRYANRVIKAAWDAAPHPELASVFAEVAPNETASVRIKRFQLLTNAKSDHPETKMLLAELFLASEDFPAARKALGTLFETDPTVRSLTIMAAIERGEGADDAIVRAWLAKAISAQRDPQWTCENCGQVHVAWAPVCVNCDSFDTLSWKRPPEGEVSQAASSAQMLPLIVGTPAPKNSEIVIVEDVEVTEEDAAKPVVETASN